MYRTSCGALGQPALPSDVLSGETSPQFSAEWSAWLDYWWQQMKQATTISDITRIRSMAVNNLYDQGVSEELVANQPGQPYGIMQSILDGMTNTAAANLGYQSGGVTSEEIQTQSTSPDTPLDYYYPTIEQPTVGVSIEPGALEEYYRQYVLYLEALPRLQQAAAQGSYPGAQATLDAALAQMTAMEANLRQYGYDLSNLDADVSSIPTSTTHAAPEGTPERYILDGMIYEFPAGHGAPTDEEIAAGIGVVGTTDVPPSGGMPVSFQPSALTLALAAGAALLLIPGKRRR